MDLVIKQNIDRTETVSSSFIDVLYQLTKPDSITGQPATNAVLVGRIQSAAAYEDAVTFLNTKFSSEQDNGSDLQITVLNNNYYIRFIDPEVVRVLTAQGVIEEGEGLTAAKAATLTFDRRLFKNNQLIEHFDEFKYFTKMNKNTDIGELFRDCTNLISTDLTNITTLYNTMCYNCNSLAWFNGEDGPEYTLSLPNLVQTWNTLASAVFAYCTLLKHITSLGIVPRLENSTFRGCTNLEDVTLPNQCVNLQASCFQDCSKLSVINLSQLTNISSRVFSACSSLEYCGGGVDSPRGELNLPNLTGTLGDEAFKGCIKLTSIASLGSITSIGNSAFENCTSLATINFPSTITSVGINAFKNTAWLNAQSGLIYAGNCLHLAKGNVGTVINITPGTVSIGDDCFYNGGTIVVTSNVTSITVPDSVKTIGESAFRNLSNLTTLDLGDGVTAIANHALNGLSSLQTLRIPASVTSIGTNDGPLSGAAALTTVTVDANNPKYDSRNNCNAIIETASNKLIACCKNSTFPSPLSALSGGCFMQSPKILDFTDQNSGLSSINITEATSGPFRGGNFEEVYFPNTVTTVGWGAFQNCYSLKKVDFGSGVTSFSSNVFHNSFGDITVVIRATTPPRIVATGQSTFNYSGVKHIQVPSSAVQTYKDVWGNDGLDDSYLNMIEAIPTA